RAHHLSLEDPRRGRDPQSRSALWDEVVRLKRDEGVTVFLTTQYLEEADLLADRVGIIDHGRIVAEGTPASLKAEIGRPTVEALPAEDTDNDKLEWALGEFGELQPSTKGVAVRLDGRGDLAEVVRALDSAQVRGAEVHLHAPTPQG